MTDQPLVVTAGVDTHGHTHHAAVIDPLGRHLADREFPATGTGYRHLSSWLSSHGTVAAVGVEGTGAYGAELSRHLARQGLRVVEVDRPDRKTRRMKGKSDPIDAYAAATAVASGRACGTPKTRDGVVEAVRSLRVVRRSAVKARTQAINQARQLVITSPEQVRAGLRGLSAKVLATTCARLRPGADLADPAQAVKFALRRLGRRIIALEEELAGLDAELGALTRRAAPELLELKGVGPDVAGQLLATAGDNPGRLASEAAFAHLCGVAPVPASSGRRDRHRLNRGGDRAANHALHTIVLVRMRWDGRTRAYVERRTGQGLSKKDIMRCLKRHVAREVYRVLTRSVRDTATNRSPIDSGLAQAA
ncbi:MULTISPECIES: IS110 family RNA-guided transposase [Nocardiopsidaceae]|uniref:IS110 family transposase n=1 Tax=Streptomonospora nanhaiensis TaxID=1323731 RepID=A0ABY6YJB3_9ACTN|nr:IS110 family transposase [Streptomonospora nanhaiensis]WAE72379.1 IS110 family transposase [Streptomonospora nanhaiensis]WAE73787.1 IS110 family transposase [Streptomonospora nanhaiensis]WAE75626.1 IS110 family transposase [Streptomonospora nanhaiensis]